MDLAFTPEEQPADYGAARGSDSIQGPSGSSELDNLGLEIGSLEPNIAEQLGLEGVKGAVITNVQPNSPADQAGLETGMVITSVNRTPVTDLASATKALKDGSIKDGILLLIRTSEGSRFIVLKG
ncbi:MAG: PDZ domain-containing protein [Planctomycetes bacterium]|nr:PDZ domain-containing protein [Planctomycetota bacterium]